MRAMKASEAVGKRFRVKPVFAVHADPGDIDSQTVGCVGVCRKVCYRGSGYRRDWPVDLDIYVNGHNCSGWFRWCELELAEDDE